jgi:glycosyltransferase involved in cell wall biosynthesis
VRRFLVQPEPGGRISGGYLYNQRMAEHAPGDRPLHLVSVPASAGESLRALGLAAGDVVVADSLFLRPERLAPFLELHARGVRLGMVLHALPSFIDRAAAGLDSGEPGAEELALLDQLDFAILPGPFLRDLLGPRLKDPRLHVCPPGLDDLWLRTAPPVRAAGEVTTIVSVGAVTPNKGFGDLVEALASLSIEAVRVAIAGSTEVDPSHVARLRARIADAGLSDTVHLLGQVPVADLGALFAAADIFVLASHTENHPLTALEALASCVPTVAYDVGGIATIVQHCVTGLLAPVGDLDTLADHLRRLIVDPDQRHAMALACWRARDRLTPWVRAAELLADALDRERV